MHSSVRCVCEKKSFKEAAQLLSTPKLAICMEVQFILINSSCACKTFLMKIEKIIVFIIPCDSES